MTEMPTHTRGGNLSTPISPQSTTSHPTRLRDLVQLSLKSHSAWKGGFARSDGSLRFLSGASEAIMLPI